jgi:glycerol-3-phosphate dehydrogenase
MLIAIPRGAIRHGLWREAGALWHLWRNGRSHGIQFQWITSSKGIKDIAPVDAVGGIFIPSVAVVDVVQLITYLQRDAVEKQAEIHYSCPAENIAKTAHHYVVSTPGAQFEAPVLVNSGGLTATAISEMAGGPRYSVQLLRGEYYELQGGIARWGIRTLVYPAMPAHSPSKGMHFGPRTDGRLFIGPNAMDASSPPAPKELFLQAARKFLPQITEEDLEYSCAGIRPKHTDPRGVSDFVIRADCTNPKLINLIGIDSPGLSSSMAIANRVADMLPSKM